jgi:hypothetical protein
MNYPWQQLVGVVLDGQYDLLELLGESDGSAFYRASFHGGRAVIQVMQEQRTAFWQRAAQLDHPNIQRILDSGTAQGMTYVVFEYPDDRLDSAAATLTGSQSHDVVAALRSAIAYLHERGFVHGAVSPEHIVAVGDTIKLESDTLHDAAAGGQATDWRQLKELAEELGVPEEGWGGASRRPWFIAGAAVLAVAALVGIMRHSTTHASRPAPYVPPVTSASPAPPPITGVAVPPPLVRSQPHPAGSWRVIAYTYTRYQDAAHKASTINQKHPDMQAEVFAPNGRNKGPFLVSLGGRVSRAEAQKLEQRAKSRGLPRDTFSRNYAN